MAAISLSAERYSLRRSLMLHYRESPRYKNSIRKDLAPALRALRDVLPTGWGHIQDLLWLHRRIQEDEEARETEIKAMWRAWLGTAASLPLRKRGRPRKQQRPIPSLAKYLAETAEQREISAERRMSFRAERIRHFCEFVEEDRRGVYQAYLDPRVHAYFLDVDQLAKHYRLCFKGRPASWAVEFIHHDVLADLGDRKGLDLEDYQYGEVRSNQTLTLWAYIAPGHGFVRPGIELDNRTVQHLQPIASAFLKGDQQMPLLEPYPYLDELEERTIEAVRCWFDELRKPIIAESAKRHADTLTTQKDKIKRLFEYLFQRDSPDLDKVERDELRNFCLNLLELDLPTKNQRARKAAA